jgi:hypothetical protein
MAKEMTAGREEGHEGEADPDKKAAVRKLRELMWDFLMKENLFILDKGTEAEVEAAREAYARQKEDLEYFKILTSQEISEILKEIQTEVSQDTKALQEEEEKTKKISLN